jgi:hypothetical protein
MFVACLLIASGYIKDHWINSDMHPVYSSQTRAIVMPNAYREAYSNVCDEEISIVEEMSVVELEILNEAPGGLRFRLLQSQSELLEKQLQLVHMRMDRLNDLIRRVEMSSTPIH